MGKVMIVEDNKLNLKLFHDLLMIKNHEVIIPKNIVNVVNVAIKKHPALILMDIQLNGVSGIDLIRNLKKNEKTKEIPIIAITAFAMKNDEIRILESGCDLYLSKPVSIDNFFLAINTFIKKH